MIITAEVKLTRKNAAKLKEPSLFSINFWSVNITIMKNANRIKNLKCDL